MPNQPIHCCECNTGMYYEVTEEYRMETRFGLLIVPDLPILRCDQCGAECLSPEACRRIDAAHKVLRNCKEFIPKRREDGTYTKRCVNCGWMEVDH